jgi:SPOR domain
VSRPATLLRPRTASRLAAVLAAAGIAATVGWPAAADTTDTILGDCVDGEIDGTYSAEALQKARKRIPSDIDEYSDCRAGISLGIANADRRKLTAENTKLRRKASALSKKVVALRREVAALRRRPGRRGGDRSPGSGSVPPARTPPAPKPEAAAWPVGKKAWTVILLSTTSKDEASELALKARKKGVPAGILQSDEYKNLSSGLWYVWAGRFATDDEAFAAATGYARKGWNGESVEYIRGR